VKTYDFSVYSGEKKKASRAGKGYEKVWQRKIFCPSHMWRKKRRDKKKGKSREKEEETEEVGASQIFGVIAKKGEGEGDAHQEEKRSKQKSKGEEDIVFTAAGKKRTETHNKGERGGRMALRRGRKPIPMTQKKEGKTMKKKRKSRQKH